MSSLSRKARRRAEREQTRGIGRDYSVPYVEDFDAFLAELQSGNAAAGSHGAVLRVGLAIAPEAENDHS